MAGPLKYNEASERQVPGGVIDLGKLRKKPGEVENTFKISITMDCHGHAGEVIVPVTALLQAGFTALLACPDCANQYRVTGGVKIQAQLLPPPELACEYHGWCPMPAECAGGGRGPLPEPEVGP